MVYLSYGSIGGPLTCAAGPQIIGNFRGTMVTSDSVNLIKVPPPFFFTFSAGPPGLL
jgi:hypothetical protein